MSSISKSSGGVYLNLAGNSDLNSTLALLSPRYLELLLLLLLLLLADLAAFLDKSPGMTPLEKKCGFGVGSIFTAFLLVMCNQWDYLNISKLKEKENENRRKPLKPFFFFFFFVECGGRKSFRFNNVHLCLPGLIFFDPIYPACLPACGKYLLFKSSFAKKSFFQTVKKKREKKTTLNCRSIDRKSNIDDSVTHSYQI